MCGYISAIRPQKLQKRCHGVVALVQHCHREKSLEAPRNLWPSNLESQARWFTNNLQQNIQQSSPHDPALSARTLQPKPLVSWAHRESHRVLDWLYYMIHCSPLHGFVEFLGLHMSIWIRRRRFLSDCAVDLPKTLPATPRVRSHLPGRKANMD